MKKVTLIIGFFFSLLIDLVIYFNCRYLQEYFFNEMLIILKLETTKLDSVLCIFFFIFKQNLAAEQKIK